MPFQNTAAALPDHHPRCPRDPSPALPQRRGPAAPPCRALWGPQPSGSCSPRHGPPALCPRWAPPPLLSLEKWGSWAEKSPLSRPGVPPGSRQRAPAFQGASHLGRWGLALLASLQCPSCLRYSPDAVDVASPVSPAPTWLCHRAGFSGHSRNRAAIPGRGAVRGLLGRPGLPAGSWVSCLHRGPCAARRPRLVW